MDNLTYDIVIIGGGATGLGSAVDAASRGYKTLLIEQHDFGKGTSSRSTKLVHGGVRYLAQGNIKLVREALAERGRLLKNAPLMTSTQPFVVPVFSLWEKIYYSAGLMLYDVLSGKLSLGKTRLLSRKKTLELLPNINPKKVAGGILYYDGQFNDAELCIELANTAERYGATVLNYTKAVGFIKENGVIVAVELEDTLWAAVGAGSEAAAGGAAEAAIAAASQPKRRTVACKSVINATGVFTDAVLQMDDPQADTLVYPSQGIHLVVSPQFFRGGNAMMIPKTDDGRVLFAVPWQGKVVIGTTDSHVDHIDLEPLPLAEEIHFVLEHFNRYTNTAITKDDVLSVFVGLRPLVRSANAGSNITSLLSRDHTLVVSPSRMVTITGGKWTTYRKMAEDAVNNAVFTAKLDGAEAGRTRDAKKCITKNLPIGDLGAARELAAQLTLDEPLLGDYLDHEFAAFHHITYAIRVVDVVVAARCKYVRTVEDFLARRSRLLFLDARAAIYLAPGVAKILQKELNWSNEQRDAQIESFIQLANQYIIH
ncbi:glycerol-3-phosphate dehydrogenase/oxidase [Sediminibacterium sp.]|uniref:glycerol-3-phosphate dehydrogenase/oxidase n=1 Tax=Sediminibacterium sp. TaxID=1917865 RepID=UPI00273772FB|nr:glycerol-3-phosphate dehydrogenase/oxidase [Sediminibacterium sp.]MDP3392456.1 glycerol-3-phosphate dehydrogenase/oxidase [Sediminibacterium sp.]MDP3565722.1 glycerol-3-phosphate dehydrogenase/oxidase [Sediminibacterium sp.]